MTARRILPALAGIAALAWLLTPMAALASCVMPPPIEDAVKSAEIVFVGTVTSTANRDAWASVTVEEVWRGPDLPATVVVKGGPGGNAATSVDRSFETGVRYLFFPSGDPEQGLADNSCSSTTPWAEAMVTLRPADVRQPIDVPADGFDLGGLVAPVGIAVLVAAVLLGVGLIARGRQES